MDENKMFEMLEKIYIEVQETNSEVKKHTVRLDNFENEVKKNSMQLEAVENKIETLSEVQKSYMGQNERHHIEILTPMKATVDVIELAIKNTAKDIKDLRDNFDKVEKVTIQNTYDVAYLKSVK